MSRRQMLSGDPGEPRGGRPGRLLAAALVGILLLALLWLGAVVVLGGGRQAQPSDESARRPADAANGPASVGRPAPEEAPQEPLAEGDPLSRDGSRDGSRDVAGEASRDRSPEDPAGVEPDPDLPEGGSSAEPGRYDPLGTGAAPGDLSPTEKGRVEQAVANYVLYAFGYTGEDQSEYNSAVNLTVVSPEFHSTPGGESVAFFSERVAAGGTESTATLEGFETSGESLEEVTGTATFTMEGSLREGRFTQELTLVKWGALWKVRSARALTEA